MLTTLLRERCVAAVMCVLLGAVGLQAQTAGGAGIIAGTVLDPEGKAVPNATVNVKNEATGAVNIS